MKKTICMVIAVAVLVMLSGTVLARSTIVSVADGTSLEVADGSITATATGEAYMYVGTYVTMDAHAGIFFIPLPVLPAGNIPVGANLTLGLTYCSNSGEPWNIDLYALGVTDSPALDPASQYYLGANDTSAEKIQDDLVSPGNHPDQDIDTDEAGDEALTIWLRDQYTDGTPNAAYAVFRLSLDAAPSAIMKSVRFKASDAAYSDTGQSFPTLTIEHAGEFTQTTWLEGEFVSQSNIQTSTGTELSLFSDPTNLVEIYDFGALGSNREEVWDMVVYSNKLYMTSCKDPTRQSPGYLYEYNGTGDPSLAYTFSQEEGAWTLSVIDGHLYAPGTDSTINDGKGRIYRYDGSSWATLNVYQAGYELDHCVNVCEYNGKLYLSNAFKNPGGYSGVLESSDGGVSWAVVKREYTFGHWSIYRMLEFNGNLFVLRGDKGPNYGGGELNDEFLSLWKFDGTTWSEILLDVDYEWNTTRHQGISIAEFNGDLYVGCYENVYRYDDSTETAVKVATIPHRIYDLYEYSGKLYAAASDDDSVQPTYNFIGVSPSLD